jgi:hypothetical protein
MMIVEEMILKIFKKKKLFMEELESARETGRIREAVQNEALCKNDRPTNGYKAQKKDPPLLDIKPKCFSNYTFSKYLIKCTLICK